MSYDSEFHGGYRLLQTVINSGSRSQWGSAVEDRKISRVGDSLSEHNRWGGRLRGTQRHFEGHTLVKIHRNSILQRLYLSLSTSREETSASSRAFFVCETNVTLMDFCEERLLSILQWGFSHALKMSHSFSWIVSPRKTSWDPLYRQRENICLVPLSLCVQSLLSDNWEFVPPYFQHV